MIPIPIIMLKKLEKKEVKALMEELNFFASHIRTYSLKSDFLTGIATYNIANYLYYMLNRKLNLSSEYCSISLKLCEAAIVVKCYQFSSPTRDEYNENVLRKLYNIIDPKLVDLF